MMRATFLISAAAAFAVSVPAQAANPTDAQIAHIAYTAGNLDIAAAKQALKVSKNKTVRDFAQAAFDAAGLGPIGDRVRSDPDFLRPVDATAPRGDARSIREALGWAPTRGFAEIVAAMVRADLEEIDRR